MKNVPFFAIISWIMLLTSVPTALWSRGAMISTIQMLSRVSHSWKIQLNTAMPNGMISLSLCRPLLNTLTLWSRSKISNGRSATTICSLTVTSPMLFRMITGPVTSLPVLTLRSKRDRWKKSTMLRRRFMLRSLLNRLPTIRWLATFSTVITKC